MNEIQENTERLRDKINEQKEYFIIKIGTIKKKQTNILELENSIKEIKNALESIGNIDHMQKRISEPKGRNLEMIQHSESEN